MSTARTEEAASDRVRELQSRIRQMQTPRLEVRTIPTHPAIAQLLPDRGLREGATYSVERSSLLLLTLLAPASAAGAWCGVIGVPDFGVEAAERFGIDLERLVLVPHPHDHWLAVTAALAEVMGVVVLRSPGRVSESQVSRLSARLRQRGTTLIVLGPWPHSDAMLSLEDPRWHGLGDGHGHLTAREVTVTVSSRPGGRPRSARLWLPDAQASISRAEEADRSHPIAVAG